MPDPDLAKTLILDIVRLDRLTKELERRYRLNPTVQVSDLLGDMSPEERAPYAAQLELAFADIKRHQELHTVDVPGSPKDGDEDLGASLQQSLMATAMFEHELAGDVSDATLQLPTVHAGGSTKPGSVRPGAGTSGSALSDATQASGSGATSGGSSPAAAPERIEQFRILRELGAGAFGVVYLAEDEQLQRKVAIKMPKVSEAKRSASYLNEARKAAAIDCKGIVPIYHIGSTEAGVPFVVQKLIDGPSMRLLLQRHKTLPPAHAATLMRDVAVALSSAHKQGIYHRDLKPDNVLIDSTGVPWIADFGLAISENEQAKRKGEIAGTLIYMSPEQIQGRADWLDGRSDIWALGIMLHELLIGKPPFSGRNRQALMEQVCHREPRPLQQTSPELAGLNDVFVRCCAKSPSQRYASVDELADDLSELINMGLSVTPIDGSELKPETPLSQYASTEGRSQRTTVPGSTTNRVVGSTHESQAGTIIDPSQLASGTIVGSTHASAGPLSLHGSTIQGSSLHGSTSGQSAPPNITSRGEQWLRIAFFLIGTVSLGVFGLIQWQRSGATVDEPSQPEAGKKELVTMPVVEPEKPRPLNKLTAAEADGTKEKPRIVAADGSGSHRTIQLALSDSKPGDWIQVSPGTYEESLKLTMPIHLIGGGDVKACVITSSQGTPIHIECESDVSVDGLTIRGTGLQSGKEFNAINLLKGKLNLSNCELKSSTWNCVKAHAGSTLEAKHCKFLESNLFSVSAKEAALVRIDHCDFFEAGIQCVATYAEIIETRFSGSQGIVLQQPTTAKTPSTIEVCTFTNCDDAVIATEGANGIVRKSEFKGCTFGIRSAGSKVLAEDVMMSGSKNAGVEVSGPDSRVDVKGASSINESKKFGCQVVDATLVLNGCTIDGARESGVVSIGSSALYIQQSNFKKCEMSAIGVMQGTLQLQGGTIEDCAEIGVYLSEEATKASIDGTHFTNSPGAISFGGGNGSIQNVVIDQSQIGVLVRNGSESPINLTLKETEFKEISEMAIDVEGDVTVEASSLRFGELPNERKFRTLAGAKVNLES